MKAPMISVCLTLILSVTTYAQIGSWKLNNNANDGTGSVNGTLMNSPAFTTSSVEGSHALTTNGTSQYVDLGTPSFPSGTSARSISAWAKTDNVSGSRSIFAYGSPTTTQAMVIGQSGTSLIGGSFANNMTVTNFWTTGVWHHICLTYDGTTAKLYADGTLVSSSTRAWNLVLSRAYIGRGVNNNDYWSGTIDDVRIYNTTLSASEVQAIATIPPSTPAGLVATAASSSSINLSWTDASNNETGFQIERATSAGGTYTSIYTTPANATSYTDATGLVANTIYYYRVKSINAGGSSAFTNETNATTLPLVPSIPTGFTATPVSSTSISLSWTDASNNETGFQIERSTTSGSGFAVIHTTLENETSYVDNISLTGGQTYYYKIKAINVDGGSAYTTEVSVQTYDYNYIQGAVAIQHQEGWDSGPDAYTTVGASFQPPQSSCTNLPNRWFKFTATDPYIKLKIYGGSISLIQYSLFKGTNYDLVTCGQTNVGTASVVVERANLEANEIYFVSVGSDNTGGGTFGLSVSMEPNAPTGLIASAQSSSAVNLSWGDNSSNETGFQIERLIVGGEYDLIGTTPSDVNTFIDTTVVDNTLYYYRVRAVNAQTTSPYSNEISLTTPLDLPNAPTGLIVSPTSSTTINLSWNDLSHNESGFQIERSSPSNGGFVLWRITGSNAVSQIDESAVPNTTYYYRVRAVNAAGNSSYTSEVSVTTPVSLPNAPTELVAASSSSTSIDLSWADNASNEVEFEIERSAASSTGFEFIYAANANITSYRDENLTPGATYFYRVRATNSGGMSSYTPEASATLPINGSQMCSNIYCDNNGGIGIGTQYVPNGFKVSVNGKMIAEGVKVALQSSWPDYVFEKSYRLRDISDLKKYIQENGHLPDVPSAEKIKREGVNVEEINVLLLEKIEEMSLYLIKMEERIKVLERENKMLKGQN